ncbi:MAG TPA: PKD domain-containing protein, partial [Arachidicoccus soli]|nr:PKD domain-containing protein [Arachidicoccus soli]
DLTTGNLAQCTWTFSDGTTLNGCDNVANTFQAAGCYDVTLNVQTTDGCINSTTINDYICVYPNPVADFTTDPQELSTANATATMVNTSVNGDTYQWTFGDEAPASSEYQPTHTFPDDKDGYYPITLIVTSNQGCVDTITKAIHVKELLLFYVPNTFTPDGDKYNATFQPVFTTGFDPYDYHLMIFDRWGELIFESYNASVGWDGTYGGKIVQDGTYVWKIEFKRSTNDEHVMKVGHVNVLR